MIEMLGVLAIIGVLSAGGIMGYTTAMENYRVNQTLEDIQSMNAQILNLFHGKTSATRKNVSSKDLLKMGIIPGKYTLNGNCQDAFDEGCYMKSLFGQDMRIMYIDGYNDKYKAFNIILYNLPTSACTKIAVKDWRQSAQFTSMGYWGGIYKGGKYVLSFGSPPSLEQARSLCDGAAYISFSFFL